MENADGINAGIFLEMNLFFQTECFPSLISKESSEEHSSQQTWLRTEMEPLAELPG